MLTEKQYDYILRQYNVTPERYRALYESQCGKCAICKSFKQLVVDHDHMCCPGLRSCGFCIRGLICRTCNTGLGMFRDSHSALAAARKYVFSFRESRLMIRTNGNKGEYDTVYPAIPREKL